MEIVLVRHGQSEANAAGVWQGQSDSPLSGAGREQAARLAKRLEGRKIDLVVASDLTRAKDTAAALGRPVEVDPVWRELHIGSWEGLTRREVAERFPEDYAALGDGLPVRLGGGETFMEFGARVVGAIRSLAGRLGDNDRAVVVAHGGVIMAAMRWVLGMGDSPRQPLGQVENTSLTTLRPRTFSDGLELGAFNDATHLAPLGGWANARLEDGDTVVTLIRHGQTDGNVGERWQGISEGDLTEGGEAQARALARWYGGVDTLYSSPRRRARDTAAPLAERLGLPVARLEGVVEMHMGDWEDLTTDQIRTGWQDLWRRIYEEGEDLPRGGTGEALAEVASRMQTALRELAHRHSGARVGVVSHGGAIHAYVLDVLGLTHREAERLAWIENTAVTHVVVGETGTRLADFNMTPHLE